MAENIIYGLFVGIPLIMVLGVVISTVRRRNQTFDDI